MDLRHAHVVAGNETIEDLGKEPALLFAKASGNAHVHRDDHAGGIDEEIAGMHVGMEEAVTQRMAQEGLDQRVGQRIKVVPGGQKPVDIRHLDAVDPFHGDDITSGPFPVHGRNAEPGIVLGILGNLRKGGGLQPQIHFDLGGLLERPGHLDRSQPSGMRQEALLQMRHQIHGFEISGEALAHAGTGHLHGHLAPPLRCVHLGRMHLRNRCGGDRLVEAQVEIFNRAPKRLADRGSGGFCREECHPVLKAGQILGEIRADDIRSGCEKLADLHIGRAQPRDRIGQSIGPVDGFGSAAGKRMNGRLGEADEGRQAFRWQRRHDAFPHQHPADPRQSEICTDRAHAPQIFQPECRAAIPPV